MAIDSRSERPDRSSIRPSSVGWLLVFFGVVVSTIIGVYVFTYRTAGGTNDLGSARPPAKVVIPAAPSTTLTVPITPGPNAPRQP